MTHYFTLVSKIPSQWHKMLPGGQKQKAYLKMSKKKKKVPVNINIIWDFQNPHAILTL